MPMVSEAKEWKSGVSSGGARKKLTKQNSGGQRNYRAPKQKTYRYKRKEYWKSSGAADNSGTMIRVIEEESNYPVHIRNRRRK